MSPDAGGEGGEGGEGAMVLSSLLLALVLIVSETPGVLTVVVEVGEVVSASPSQLQLYTRAGDKRCSDDTLREHEALDEADICSRSAKE